MLSRDRAFEEVGERLSSARLGQAPSLARSARTVGLRALVFGSIAFAYCLAVLSSPGPLDSALVLQGLTLGATLGGFAIGLPSVVECWLVTWSEQRVLRGILLLYLAGLIGWLLTGAQVVYLFNVAKGFSPSASLVQSVGALTQHPPLLLMLHVSLPAALALASLRHLRWTNTAPKHAWVWVILAVLVFCLVSQNLGLLRISAVVMGLEILLGLAYLVVRALQIRLWPQDAEVPSESRAKVEVDANVGGP